MKRTVVGVVIFALLNVGLSFGLSGCTLPPAPMEDYALARAAIDAAKAVEAGKYSPGYLHKAEVAYRDAQTLFDERNYREAREVFAESRTYAERAENSARLIRFKNGDVL